MPIFIVFIWIEYVFNIQIELEHFISNEFNRHALCMGGVHTPRLAGCGTFAANIGSQNFILAVQIYVVGMQMYFLVLTNAILSHFAGIFLVVEKNS